MINASLITLTIKIKKDQLVTQHGFDLPRTGYTTYISNNPTLYNLS